MKKMFLISIIVLLLGWPKMWQLKTGQHHSVGGGEVQFSYPGKLKKCKINWEGMQFRWMLDIILSKAKVGKQ